VGSCKETHDLFIGGLNIFSMPKKYHFKCPQCWFLVSLRLASVFGILKVGVSKPSFHPRKKNKNKGQLLNKTLFFSKTNKGGGMVLMSVGKKSIDVSATTHKPSNYLSIAQRSASWSSNLTILPANFHILPSLVISIFLFTNSTLQVGSVLP